MYHNALFIRSAFSISFGFFVWNENFNKTLILYKFLLINFIKFILRDLWKGWFYKSLSDDTRYDMEINSSV